MTRQLSTRSVLLRDSLVNLCGVLVSAVTNEETSSTPRARSILSVGDTRETVRRCDDRLNELFINRVGGGAMRSDINNRLSKIVCVETRSSFVAR